MEKVYYNTIAKSVEEAEEFNQLLIIATDNGWDLATFNITEKSGEDGKVYMVALMKKTVDQNAENDNSEVAE